MSHIVLKSKKEKLFKKIFYYLRSSNGWFFTTPERALEEARQAALMIQSIENEHFGGNKITEDTTIYSQNILNHFLDELERNLSIIKLRLAEFRVSRFFLNQNYPVFWEKLKFIDGIASKYEKDSSVILTQPDKVVQERKNGLLELENGKGLEPKRGVLPRSIGRTVRKITTDLDGRSEEKLLSNFRFSKRKTRAAISFLLMLIFLPLLAQKVSQEFLFDPLVENFRSNETAQIFLNDEMKEEAIRELQSFEEGLRFESLLFQAPKLSSEIIEEKVIEKANEIASNFSHISSGAISNIFADLVGLIAFALVAIFNQPGLNALKALLGNIVYDLSDSAKAFIIILFTDIFVGFHSPHGWEVILEGIARHFGLPANHSFIFLFIATFPVILDTIFKYWIFRYLNQISPSAVATLKNMNE